MSDQVSSVIEKQIDDDGELTEAQRRERVLVRALRWIRERFDAEDFPQLRAKVDTALRKVGALEVPDATSE